jgi:hypothetical protein
MNPPPLPRQKRFPWIIYWIVLALIVLFACAPIGSVIACAVIANAYGCKVDEGSVHPCIINGQDYGHTLYTLGVMGWLMLVTIPAGVFAFVIWVIVLILHRERWRKRLAAGVVSMLLVFVCVPLNGETDVAATMAKPAFAFAGVDYFHRWSKNTQHEFTPARQEDLEKWSEMLTVNVYPDVHDGDALAAKANAVLENYKAHHGMVVRTNSVPRTPDRPAEHFIAVVFGRPNFIEIAFTRFKLVEGTGCSIAYSHRIYGEKVGDQMSAWLNQSGPNTEKTLMDWNAVPSPSSLSKLPQKVRD